jgi:3-oxoacyl-[acyl-carrier protein] reductase
MNQSLAGKVVLVTGGARGLGAATAKALGALGADVAISYVNSADKAEAVVRELEALGARSAAFKADQGDRVAATRLIDDVVTRFGRLDILVSNASINIFGVVDDPDYDAEAFDRFWAVTLTGFMATVRAASRVISDNGRIIMIGSNLGTRVGMAGLSDNGAVKAAIDGYARGVARDLAPRNVTVNVVHAGLMETDMNAEAGDSLKPLLATLCFPRFARIEEVVAPILFLASPQASYITGAIIDADGGYNA